MPVLQWAWVTVVIDEETCLQSLVLAKSLRAVITTGDIIVIVAKRVPEPLRNALSEVFDMLMVFGYEDETAQNNSLAAMDMGKIFSWSLTSYEKCIVLNPSFLVVRNCDKLFESNGNISVFLSTTDSEKFICNLIIMKPSYAIYKQLMNNFEKQSILFEGKLILKKCIDAIYLEEQINILDPANLELVDLSNNFGKFLRQGVQLFDFQNVGPSLILSESTKIMSNEACAVWRNICLTEVVPLIKNEKIKCVDLNALKSNIRNTLEENITKEAHREKMDCIAIVGQSCRLPGANSVDEFWKLLEAGGDGTRTIPIERLLEHQVDDPAYNNIRAGYLKCAIDEFDAKFFGISPREAGYMDPQQRLLVEVAWEALEDAAINPETLKGSNTGVFSGIWTHEFESQLTQHTSGKDFHHVILGNAHSAVSARISYFLGLNGPNVATESGCSSSMVALHLACDSLRKRETNLALATGANLLLAPFPYRDVIILAKDGHCKTFDEKADGFARAEGIVVIVLKRLSDAVRDGDRIISLIRGSALSSEGMTSSFGTPSKYCQEIAIRDALRAARVNPQDVDYVEAHGTGTPIGDPIEFSAISSAYKSPRRNPLMIGSVKTNTGHTESAAGLAGLLKVNLAINKQQIPPHCNLQTLNPNIDLTILPAVIPLQNTQWVRDPQRKRLAGISSFGISGTNVHIIVEEPPIGRNIELKSTQSDRTHHLLALSAKTENALKDLVDNYSTHLADYNDLHLKDVCYTANVGRQHLKHRFAVVAKDVEEMTQKLANPVFVSETLLKEHCKIVFLFTGQGSQYNSMAKTLYETSSIFKQALNICDEILKNNYGISINDALFDQVKSQYIDLNETIYSQISIFCVEYGLLKLWESFGIKPDYVLGHSTGEFAASVAAEVMSLKEALCLVIERSRLIHGLTTGGMLAVRTNIQKVESMIKVFNSTNQDDWLDIAVINSMDEVVVAGKSSSLKRFSDFCFESKVKSQLLAASHAFHSRDMESMLPEFDKVASKIKYKSPCCYYVSGSTGKLLRGDDIGSDYWQKHVRHTVDFTKGIDIVHNEGCNVFIEIGAHPILLALGMSNLPPIETQYTLWLPSIRKNEENWYTMLDSLSKLYVNGVNVDWEGFDSCYQREKIRLPHYPFQRQKYWFDKKSEPLTKALHPLLGRKVPLAVIKDHVYQNLIGLRDFSYLADHQVANIILMPGAGFLELIVAAGKDAMNLKSGQGSIEVKNFVIEAPMEIEEDGEQKIQVIASSAEDGEGFIVQILMFNKYRGYKDDKCWQLLASAEVFSKDNEKADNTLEEIKSRCVDTISVEQFYKTALQVGIKFGETFQSISNIKKGNEEVVAQINFPSTAGNLAEYLRHPIVLDAMLQLAGLVFGRWNSELHLPVGISNTITTLCESPAHVFYAHATKDKDDLCVNLYNEKSQLLCKMTGVRLVKTSIGSFMNVINAHKNKLPGMFVDVWRPRYSHLHSRVDFSSLPNLGVVIKDIGIKMKDIMNTYDTAVLANVLCDKICAIGFTICVLELGWNPLLGDLVNVGSFMSDYLLVMEQAQFIERLFYIFEEESILKRVENSSKDETAWIVNQHILPKEELVIQRDNLIEKINKDFDGLFELPIILHCGANMKDMLQGNVSPMEILFGNEDPKVNPLEVYKGRAMNTANIKAEHFMVSKFQPLATSGSILRIIEIGAGSGATSKKILHGLQKHGIPFHYTFTDISQYFLDEAEKQFKNISGMEYKLLNIEKDPKYQGFVPYTYDVVVAANVIHATQYLNCSIQNVRQLLAPAGILVLQEMLKPIRLIDVVYGTIEGYWRFKDYDIRKNHPCVNESTWNKLCTKNGFKYAKSICEERELVSIIIAEATDVSPIYLPIEEKTKSSIWLIFSGENYSLSSTLKQRIENSGGQCFIVTDISLQCKEFENVANKFINYGNESEVYEFLTLMDESYHIQGQIILFCLDTTNDQSRFCMPVLYITKYLANCTSCPKVIVATSGVFYIGDQTNVNPSQATVWGIIKSCRSERPDLSLVSVDLDPDSKDPFSHVEQIFSEVWLNNESLIAYRNKKRHVLRSNKQFINPVAPLVLPNGRYEIALPTTKNIIDVSFKSMQTKTLQPFEVEVVVKAAALNFRDIFTIVKPEMYHTRFESVGIDFGGIISEIGDGVTKYKVGDEVFGSSFNSCVASHVVANSKCMLHKPQEFTFAEVCTLPAVFLTAYHCMINVAGLQKAETVLIHVASGGVGLVAIQIAKLVGSNIIATAGNKRKRAYLRSLGIRHVFHSRDLTFGANIDKVTQGRGVDMVLNSLTGQGFKEASLKACARNARFIEIGKVNIWQPQDVAKLRQDVKYAIVDLEIVMDHEKDTLMSAMADILTKKQIQPIPYTQFSVSQIKDALNYFMKAIHIGKVVVTMPEINVCIGRKFVSDLLFSINGTYLITGGLGGIGLEVAKWMVKCGARHVVLVGRTLPTEDTKQVIKSLSSKGVQVISRQVDVGNMQHCKILFALIKSEMPPLRGVIHSAGTLSDGMIRNQTWERFESVFNAKVKGGWNLHQLTEKMSLEHFVVFSSIAASVGPLGQSNHAAANMYLDSLIFYRHSLGLPGQTINWGAWSEIGAATNSTFGKEGALGLKPFTPSQGIAALQFVMAQPIIQIGIAELNVPEFAATATEWATVYFSEILESEGSSDTNTTLHVDQFWIDINDLSEEDRVIYIKKSIAAIIRKTLKLPESEILDDHQSFSDMGLDSLMTVEMRNKLQQLFGKHLILNPTFLLDYPNLSSLCKHLAFLTMSVEWKTSESVTTQSLKEEIMELVSTDCRLPNHIKVCSKPVVKSKIKSVLITGVTGHFGPYLLHEFAQNCELQIFCLVRAKTLQIAEKRVVENLKKFKLAESTPLMNVNILLGDITEENLGMSVNEYESLTQQIDSVFHCAVKANHIEEYRKSKSNKDIRSVNVLGTIKMLEFATAFKTKRFAFVSSYTAANALNNNGIVSDELPADDNIGDGLELGYALTKFVGEKLVGQALFRGVPCTVLRFPTLTGHSVTGHFTTDTNFVMNFILTAARLKVFVDIPGGWNIIPVDIAAKISSRIFLNEQAQLGLYNIMPNEPFTSQGYIDIAQELGMTVSLVNEKFFIEKLNSDEHPLLNIFKEATRGGRIDETFRGASPVCRSAVESEKKIFILSDKLRGAVHDVEKIIPSPYEIIRRQFRYALTNGILDAMEIEYDKSFLI